MSIQPTPLRPLPGTDFEVFRRAFPDFVRHVSDLRKLRDREFAKLASLGARDRHSRTRKLLRSRDLHLLYAYEAIRKLKRLRTITPSDIEALAAQCNPLHPKSEPVAVHWVAGHARRRPVTSFGPVKRMQQMFVGHLLRSLHPPSENQYLFRGGMPMAFRAVEAAIRDGFTFGTEVDFTDFYGSVRLEGLAEMLRPLPRAVVQHVVWDRPNIADCVDDDTVSMSWASPSPDGHVGLVLGSACSPIVGERIIASLLAHGHDDQCRIVTYADNILVLGRTAELVEECYRQMQARAATFAGWPSGLRTRHSGIRNLMEQEFEFLHHSAWLENDAFIWAPDQRKAAEYLLSEEDNGEIDLAAIERAEDKLTHWRRAYPGWPDGDRWEARQLAGLAARRFYLAASPLNRINAANSIVASYFAGERLEAVEEIVPTGTSSRDEQRRAELIDAAYGRLIMIANAGSEMQGVSRVGEQG